MSWKAFLRIVFLISFSLTVGGMIFSFLFNDISLIGIYLFGVTTFLMISLLIFLYAHNTSKSDNLFSFNNVVVVSFIFKLLLSIGVLMIFERYYQPTSKAYLLHFILIYLIYTAYEVYFLTKLARTTENNE